MSQYPPSSTSRHRPSTSASSNAHTLVSHEAASINTGVPRNDGRRSSNHTRQAPSAYSLTSTLNNPQSPNLRPSKPKRLHSKSLSSTLLQPPPAVATYEPASPQSSYSKTSPTSMRRPPDPVRDPPEHTCCGVVQESAAKARADRYGPHSGTKPQPWIVRKFMVGVTLGIMGYAAYVYVGLLVLPMLQEKRGAGGSRTTGIGLLVGFALLFLWMVWAYIRVIFTSPGFAKDHVQKTEKPSPTIVVPLSYHDPERGTAHHIAGPSYEDMSAMLAASSRPPPVSRVSSEDYQRSVSGDSTRAVRRGEGVSGEITDVDTDSRPTTTTTMPQSDPDRILVRKLRKQTPSAAEMAKANAKDRQRKHGWLAVLCCCLWCADDQGPRRYISRRPPTTPTLDPLRRYCDKDGLIRPYRTHHCRTCGTCVLKYDHHCPWIGQCVGARNQKFFLNFCQAAFVCTTYIAASLLPFTIKGLSGRGYDASPQQIVIIAFACLFALFTCALTVTHTYYAMHGQTTVESIQISTMKAREQEQLSRAFRWWECSGKAHTLREWDNEWGHLSTEGNIWWLGSKKREWEAVMGKNPLGWILPIGRSEFDGLDYPVNPRFDQDGRWRRRADWPEELR